MTAAEVRGWLAVTFDCEARDAGALADALLEAGALAVDLSDAIPRSGAEPPPYVDTDPRIESLWRCTRVRALFPRDTDVTGRLDRARQAGGLAAIGPLAIESVPEQDWVRETQRQFEPVRIPDRLWITPSWSAPPDTSAINVVLDPGLAFGTGTHATTQLVLRWLERTVRGGFDVAISAWSIDYADPVTFFGPLLNGNNLQAAGNSGTWFCTTS